MNQSFFHSTIDARMEQLENEMGKQVEQSVKLTKE
jgi:hypothetical protein